MTGRAWADSWKHALGDADELYDAAEDLHDRAQRFKDYRVMPVTENLEHMTADLYQRMKQGACAAEVVPLFNATGAVLEEAAMLVTLSCEMRGDRKSLSELDNARRYYAATAEHIQCILRTSARPAIPALPRVQVHAPTVTTPPWATASPYSVTPYGPAPYTNTNPGFPPTTQGWPGNSNQPGYAQPGYPQPGYPQPGAQPNVPPYEYETHYHGSQPNNSSTGRALARVIISELLAR